ncbi:FixH family protein [Sorangium sp. So ce341]|uniref:FixH family protein n=1 Tax=Sorangium sp. So ce341 TaxID=3133302 RepID=UPI003F63BBB4
MIEPRDRPSTTSPRARRGARARLAALAALALLALQGCGAEGWAPDPGRRLDAGMNGRIEFSVASTAPLAIGANTFHVRLTWLDSRNPVQRIKLRVYSMMLGMRHESVHDGVEIEPGVYEVADVPFSMAGTYDMQVRALAASLIDEAEFSFEVY